MTTLSRTLLVSAVGLAALAQPALAATADLELRGAPSMRAVDARQATLQFTTDERLDRTKAGRVAVRVTFAGGQRVSDVKLVRRHGSDFVYTARVRSDRDLRVGTKYTVRFSAGEDSVTRKVKLHPKQGS